MVYLGDAFNIFAKDDDFHWIPLGIYLALNIVCFFCITQLCICFSSLWVQYANYIKDEQEANRGTRKLIKILLRVNPFFIILQLILVRFEEYQTLSLIYGLLSLLIGGIATYSG